MQKPLIAPVFPALSATSRNEGRREGAPTARPCGAAEGSEVRRERFFTWLIASGSCSPGDRQMVGVAGFEPAIRLL